MPKEMTHWLIAEEVGRRVSVGTDNPAMLRVGAIVHDVLYYRSLGASPRCIAVANFVHGSEGEDTFTMVRNLASDKTFTPNGTDSLRAFLLGAVTHICADVIFHPYIYYASGNPSLPNMHYEVWKNHRALESAIDSAFCHDKNIRVDSVSLYSDITRQRHDIMPILNLLAHEQRKSGWEIQSLDYWRGYTALARLRPILTHSFLNTVLDESELRLGRLMDIIVPPELHSYMGLRYSAQSPWAVADIHTPFRYQHPVSGEEHSTTLHELFDVAVRESVRVWELLEKTLLCGAPLLEEGKSLEVGLRGVPAAEMRYFTVL